MQPIVLGPYTPLGASATYFASAAWDGVGPFYPTTTTISDGLAHQVTLTVATSNYSSISFTLTGVDADGNTISETLAGPNNNTVTSVLYYAQLTKVSVSAELTLNKVSAGIGATSLMQTVPLDARSVAAALIAAEITGTINYTVSQTSDDVFVAKPSTSCTWFAISDLSAKNANVLASSNVGARGLQVKVNSLTSTPTIKVSISQASSALG